MRYEVESLRRFAAEVLVAVGMPSAQADAAAEALLCGDIRGVESHGISKLPIYVKRIKAGSMDATAVPRVVSQHGGIARIDAENAMGHVAGSFAADVALQLARKHGFGLTMVANSNHFGITAYYSMKHIDKGVIGFAFSNANPTMAPWGGKTAMLGTSPLSVAVPSAGELPIVLDMASTTVARGKVILYAQEGKQLPPGWALDRDGQETLDPEIALTGLLAPLGGAKGSGLSMIIDILCGVLTGSRYLGSVGPLYTNIEHPQGLGHVVGALDIASIMPTDSFLTMIREYIEEIHACPAAEGGDRVLVPGEIEHERAKHSMREGVEISTNTREALLEMAAEQGVWVANTL